MVGKQPFDRTESFRERGRKPKIWGKANAFRRSRFSEVTFALTKGFKLTELLCCGQETAAGDRDPGKASTVSH